MKAKTTRRALVMSLLSLLLCCSMLVGTTFAWFTDSVTSGNNKIVAGNLDIELYWSTDCATWTKVDKDTNIFDTGYWEPGHTEVVYLKAANEGTLALKYQLGVNVASETGSTSVLGNEFKLSQYIQYGVVETDAKIGDRKDAVAAVTNATALQTPYSSDVITLAPKGQAGDAETVALVVYMPETVGNEANHRGAEPTILLGLNVYATQKDAETDSFGSDYDAGVKYAHPVGSAAELIDALEVGLPVVLKNDITYDAAIVIPEGGSIDGNGNTITYSGTDYHLVKLNTGAELKNVTLENYRVRTENTTNGVVTLTNVVIDMDNDQTGLDISRGAGTAKLTNATCKGITDAAHLNPDTQVQVGYTPYGDVLLGSKWGLEATDCAFGSLHGWNTTNGSNVSLNNTTMTVFRMHYWNNRVLYVNGVETAWAESGAIPVAHDVGGCWSVQPAFK